MEMSGRRSCKHGCKLKRKTAQADSLRRQQLGAPQPGRQQYGFPGTCLGRGTALRRPEGEKEKSNMEMGARVPCVCACQTVKSTALGCVHLGRGGVVQAGSRRRPPPAAFIRAPGAGRAGVQWHGLSASIRARHGAGEHQQIMGRGTHKCRTKGVQGGGLGAGVAGQVGRQGVAQLHGTASERDKAAHREYVAGSSERSSRREAQGKCCRTAESGRREARRFQLHFGKQSVVGESS